MKYAKAGNNRVPKYCLHKASGRAVVRLSGSDHYLGQYGSDQSHEAYNRLIAQWLAVRKEKQQVTERSKLNAPQLSVGDLLTRYRKFAETYYVYQGKSTKECKLEVRYEAPTATLRKHTGFRLRTAKTKSDAAALYRTRNLSHPSKPADRQDPTNV